MNNRDDLGNIHSITPKHLCTEVKSQAPSYSFMPWSRCQPHGFILSWRNIPVNRIGRFYSMFVWMENAAFSAGEYAGTEMWKPHCGRPRLRQRVKSGSRTAASLDSLQGLAE